MAGSSSHSKTVFGWLTDNLGTKIVSVLVAIVLWVIILGSRTVEVTKDIPVILDLPSELAPASEVPSTVSFKIVGPKAFIRTILDRREPPIRINLTQAKPGTVTYQFFPDSIRLPLGVQVQSVTPNSIAIDLESVRVRTVPVRLDLRGTPPDGHQLIKAQVVPPTLKIRGPKSKVLHVTEIQSLPIDLFEVRGIDEKPLPVDLVRYGVQVEGETPQLTLDVRPTSANFRLKNVPVRVLADRKVILLEKSVTLFVRTEDSTPEDMDTSKVVVEVDLRNKAPGRYEMQVRPKLPSMMSLVRALPETVNVQIVP